MNAKLQNAKTNLINAKKRMASVTAQAAPVGCRVAVTLGNARVIGTVNWSGRWGHEPDRVGITNIKTGKQRTFNASFHEWNRLGV